MLVCKTIKEVSEVLVLNREQGKSIGFVPTMGALHRGHISLIERAKSENDIVLCSIFVNPTQFNNPDDLKNYPRTFDVDAEMLEKSGCDLVFFPTAEMMYPDQFYPDIDLGGLDLVMEGSFRQGHFKGVATIVKKFFEILNPNSAYFGEKDYQQYLIIKHITKHYFPHISIIPCAIIRESDGLAMSSRNMLLNEKERETASLINKELKNIIIKYKGENIQDLINQSVSFLNEQPNTKVEYIVVANQETLEISDTIEKEGLRLFAAVYVGKVRLIDNIKLFCNFAT